ncbi:TetR/AcrR family transcriptional regulator [uncultured Corynebacterium sp.]|uniref:TetR/AcrR family transcriptional regulator n=1 Tax=uncultured Corynebacterium sp. TaxID=159447 RepID=UPI0025E14A51|nr:TetR/AcrR family transcriptional regulator [uncultured Corynebacterium sp.]
MPREVDTTARLRRIADATLTVAREQGTRAVTLRAVAKELGGSTTLVTNYLKTRADLILNALDHADARWGEELEDALSRCAPADRLLETATWALFTRSDDMVPRALIIEILANATVEPEMAANLAIEAGKVRNQLLTAAEESGFRNPEAVAETVYLMVRGASFANIEDAAHWPEERALDVIRRVLDVAERV